MIYEELPCRSGLEPWLVGYWYVSIPPSVEPFEHMIPPTGGAMISFSTKRPAILTGPRTDALCTRVGGEDEIWGVHLWPGTLTSLLGVDAPEARDANLPLVRCVEPRKLAAIERATGCVPTKAGRIAALDDALTQLVADASPLDAVVMDVVLEIIASEEVTSIEELATTAGISSRQLRRRFGAAVGLTPKELARVRRFLRSLYEATADRGRRWVELARRFGYSDQAHLVREYKRVIGMSPTGLGDRVDRIEHHVGRGSE